MLNLQVIDFNQKEKWNNIADNTVEVYDKWQYASAFFKNGDGIPYMAYMEGKEGYIYNVFLKRNINTDERFKNIRLDEQLYDIITPYGYGGVKIKGNITGVEKNEFFKQFEKYCKANNIVSEFIRMTPVENNYANYEGQDYKIEKNSKTIYIKLDNEEQIWNDFEGRSRTTIRKALKNEVTIKTGLNNKMMDEFKNIYYNTMKRDGANSYYFFKKEFFDDIEQNLKDNATIYTAYINNIPISSSIIIYSGKNVHYHLSGSDKEYMKFGANNLILYQVSKDFLKKGYKKFHLGGGYGGDDSPLFKFKKSFNKNGELDFYIGKKIFNVKLYEELINMREKNEKIENTNFFPLYRA